MTRASIWVLKGQSKALHRGTAPALRGRHTQRFDSPTML